MSKESEEGVTVLRQGGSSKSESCQELRIWSGKVVSTLYGPIWSTCSIALTCPDRSHFQRTQTRKDGARVGMNVTAHKEKEKNEETKKDRRKE